MRERKVLLAERDIPRKWYNIAADLPTPPAPPLHPATKEPLSPEDLVPIFPRALLEQEVSAERWVPIPEPVLDVLRLWRPTPLYRAYSLEEALGTRSRIYYKYEGTSPAGSHKPNTSVAQAYYNKAEGVKRLSTETGAGQWGSALALASRLFGLECAVYMVRVSYEQKPYRRSMIEAWGAIVVPSPSELTAAGRNVLASDPETTGSLGIAISEAVEDALGREDTKYSLGSVLNHVLLHQTVIGLETQEQFKLFGDAPQVVIGCCGGGSNFAGLAFPYARDKIAGANLDIVAVEPVACPTLTRGRLTYDHGDTAGLTPLMPMHTLGHGFVPPGIHAGGLRYHGMAPLVSGLLGEGVIRAESYNQMEVFEAAVTFARTEGIIPAPEAAHAVKSAVEAASRADQEGVERTILFGLSGHGHFDMSAFDAYLKGELKSYELPDEALQEGLAPLAGFPTL
jgi:tryptophan synthase beta chain